MAARGDTLTHLSVSDVGTDGIDQTHRLGSRASRKIRQDAVLPAHGHEVVVVDGGESDAHPHLFRARFGPVDLIDGEHLLRGSEGAVDCCAHGVSLSSAVSARSRRAVFQRRSPVGSQTP